MNIAELFVNLGIKGADKTLGALGSVKKTMGDLGSTSLETKAAILGAMYGLERMMALSGAAGTNLTNFTALTGKSGQELQRWQYAARQAGVGADELTGSVKAVQMSMANMLMGKGAPEGLALLSKAVGGIKTSDYTKPFEMMKILQQGLQKMSPEMGILVGKSFGLSEGTIAAMKRNMFTPQMLAKAPTYSDKEVGSLDKSNIAWSNLNNKIQMAFGHFNAAHGGKLVGEIDQIAMAVLHLTEALVILAEKTKVFALIGWSAEKTAQLFNVMGIGADDLLGNHKKSDNKVLGKDSMLKKVMDWRDDMDTAGANFFKDNQDMIGKAAMAGAQGMSGIAPTVSLPPSPVAGNTHTVNQTIVHHGDAKDTKAVKDLHKASINHAYRQRSAQRQGS